MLANECRLPQQYFTNKIKNPFNINIPQPIAKKLYAQNYILIHTKPVLSLFEKQKTSVNQNSKNASPLLPIVLAHQDAYFGLSAQECVNINPDPQTDPIYATRFFIFAKIRNVFECTKVFNTFSKQSKIQHQPWKYSHTTPYYPKLRRLNATTTQKQKAPNQTSRITMNT